MKKKILIFLPSFSLLFIGCKKNNGLEGTSAIRSLETIAAEEIHYLDNEAIALADSSNSKAFLRGEALRTYNLVNEERRKANLEPLVWDSNLESTSIVRAMECSQFFSHTRPNKQPWYTVNSQIMGGENLAYGYSNAIEVLNGWMDSPTHKENILYPDFTKVSVSLYVTDNGEYYWSQEFGY